MVESILNIHGKKKDESMLKGAIFLSPQLNPKKYDDTQSIRVIGVLPFIRFVALLIVGNHFLLNTLRKVFHSRCPLSDKTTFISPLVEA
jgi:hypothetical protein